MTLEGLITAVVNLVTGFIPATEVAIILGAAFVVGFGIAGLKRLTRGSR